MTEFSGVWAYTPIKLAKRFEGFERRVKRGIEITAVPYNCPACFWTIGYGNLCDPKQPPPITEFEAEVYLARDLQSALAATLRYFPLLATGPERLAAIVDFTFKLGAGQLQTSTLRRIYGGGKVLPGLVARREQGASLLNNVFAS